MKRFSVLLIMSVVGLGICHFLSCNSDNVVDPTHNTTDLYANYDNHFKALLSESSNEMGKNIIYYQSIAADLIPKQVTISATHYQLGQLIGKIFQKHFNGANLRPRTQDNETINQQIITMYQRIYPQQLALYQGVADANGTTLEKVDLRHMEHEFFLHLWWDLFQYQRFVNQTSFSKGPPAPLMGCSVISYFLKKEQTHLIGRNFDNPSNRPQFCVSSAMEGSYKVLGNSCYALYHWITDGVNERGLFVGVATNGNPSSYNVKEFDYPDEPAVQIIHLVRIVLETSATVEEAINLIGSVRVWFPVEVNHLLIADADGNSAIVEFDPTYHMVSFRRGNVPYQVLTNTAYQEGSDYLKSHCWRFNQATQRLSADGVGNMNDLVGATLLIQLASGSSQTPWTSFYDLSELTMDVRYRSEQFVTPHQWELNN